MDYKTGDIKAITKEYKKKMIISLLKYDMYYECKELCIVFINNTENKHTIRILNDIIKECSLGTRKQYRILEKLKEW